MTQLLFPNSKQYPYFGAILVLVVIAFELALIHFARHRFGFECFRETAAFCDVARTALLASYGLAGALVLIGLFDPRAMRHLLRHAGLRSGALMLNCTGLSALVASLPLIRLDLSPLLTAGLYAGWAVAGGAVVTGAVLMISPPRVWRAVFVRLGWVVLPVLLAGLAAPFAAGRLKPLWDTDQLAGVTFDAVAWLLTLWGSAVESFPETRVIGAGEFFVNIAPSCSGIEGLVLTTTFATIYMALFRRDLRFPHALLILPVALCASWALNVVRIAVLVQIGIAGYPGLAVGGFHSHAGWLMFTLLSLMIVLTAQTVPWFHRAATEAAPEAAPADAPREVTPFLNDPVVAQILPFLVFMASALFASTFAQDPALAYPMRAAAMGIALALFWPYLETLPWRVDPVSVLAGLGIAALWIVTAPAPEVPHPIAALGGAALAVWIVARIVGTALFVPVIEELFFRGYLLGRLAPPGAPVWRAALGIAVTTALFAVLHDRWLEAAVAGVAFGLLALRARNVTDAVIAHAVANAAIAVWALATGNWAMI